MYKFVIAPDSYKGTMSSIDAAGIMEKGLKKVDPTIETIKIPVADGGEGTVEAYIAALGGTAVVCDVTGPMLSKTTASYGILDDGTAVMEMAQASGLMLVGDDKNPLEATTLGTGQMIADALNRGVKKIVIGIGGSATNDGGIGMASALGVRFLDRNGKDIPPTGGGLALLSRIDVQGFDKRVKDTEILVACDVDNPLYGPNGASHIYAPQKGATPEMVEILDRNLKQFAQICERDTGVKVDDIPGGGAAGGLGAGLIAFCGARLQSGIRLILDMVKFEEKAAWADFIITGEGKIDGQSLRGKVPAGVAARSLGRPVIAIVGDIGDPIEEVYSTGICAVLSTNRVALPFSESKLRAKRDLEKTAETVMRMIRLAGK